MPICSKGDYLLYLSRDGLPLGVSRQSFMQELKNPVVRFQRVLRKAEYIHNCKTGALWRAYEAWLKWRLLRMGVWLGFTIPLNVFGPGLSIAHWGTIVVNGNATVGANCRIHPGTCIGEHDGKAPNIGDNVYIGPGSKLYGDIVIGSNVHIGANAVVNRSFPDNVTIAGMPARIIADRAPVV